MGSLGGPISNGLHIRRARPESSHQPELRGWRHLAQTAIDPFHLFWSYGICEVVKQRLGFGAILGAATFLSCGAAQNSSLRDDLSKRASFDFQCKSEQLQLQGLSEQNGIINSYGVSGCGKRATYVLSPTGTWILNSDSDSPQVPTAVRK